MRGDFSYGFEFGRSRWAPPLDEEEFAMGETSIMGGARLGLHSQCLCRVSGADLVKVGQIAHPLFVVSRLLLSLPSWHPEPRPAARLLVTGGSGLTGLRYDKMVR